MSLAPSPTQAVGAPARGAGTGLRTEFAFVLPRGYVDANGGVHREGTMRLATARDEIIPQRDPRVRENEAYLTVLLLSRVVTRLGSLPEVHPGIVEGMFASDLAFLQDLYRRVNQEGTSQVAVSCPACQHDFTIDLGADGLGGIVTYAADRLFEEVAYVAYHFHWSMDEIMDLEHADRHRFAAEISTINRRLTEEE